MAAVLAAAAAHTRGRLRRRFPAGRALRARTSSFRAVTQPLSRSQGRWNRRAKNLFGATGGAV